MSYKQKLNMILKRIIVRKKIQHTPTNQNRKEHAEKLEQRQQLERKIT